MYEREQQALAAPNSQQTLYARPFTSDEAAEWLGISRRQLLQLTRDGIVPATKVGQRWRYSQHQLALFAGVAEDPEPRWS